MKNYNSDEICIHRYCHRLANDNSLFEKMNFRHKQYIVQETLFKIIIAWIDEFILTGHPVTLPFSAFKKNCNLLLSKFYIIYND